MKTRYLVLLALLGALASGAAAAHGRGGARVHLGFVFGPPFAWHYPYYYPPPVYYYPAPVAYPASPPVYVEREPAAPEAPAASWWYYCDQSRTYYPYVKTCPGGWQRVPPTPQPGGPQ